MADTTIDKKNQDDVEKQVKQMREWLNHEPHLPKDIDDRLLERFIHSCYYDLEKAKKAAELFFTIRGGLPELLTNRDPLSPQVQKIFKITNLAQINISKNRNLWVWQLNDPGLDNYDYVQDAKLFFLSMDSWLLNDNRLEEADIVIMDVKDITLKFLTKFNMSLAKKLSKYQEEAVPIRLNQIHVVNAPSFIDKVFAIMKPFLRQESTEMIHFHTAKSNNLHDYLSKEDLPSDYGGTLPSMDEHMNKVIEVIIKNREHLLNTKLWTATEKKSKNKKEIPTEIPTFRGLAID